jgi:hypothetical protein
VVETRWWPRRTRRRVSDPRGEQPVSWVGARQAQRQALGRAEALERALSPDNKIRLVARGDEVIRRGIFGAPSFVVGDELFWGNDRLEQAIGWALSPPDLPPLA